MLSRLGIFSGLVFFFSVCKLGYFFGKMTLSRLPTSVSTAAWMMINTQEGKTVLKNPMLILA